MSPKNQAARTSRARRLREQIKRLITPAPQPKKSGGEAQTPADETRPGESARDFTQRKMREEAADES